MPSAWTARTIRVGFASAFVGLTLAACGGSSTPIDPPNPTTDVGDAISTSLIITANGEDLVRRGWTTKDGWTLTFDQVLVTMAEVTAFRADPPYDASSGVEPRGEMVSIGGPVTIDLAAGGLDADPVVVGVVPDAPSGHYNALSWRMVPAWDADARGASLQLSGTATNDGDTIRFTLSDDSGYTYRCGEYVGEGRKGMLTDGGSAQLEATFHFDHVFGDADVAEDEALNADALGFSPLAAMAVDGALVATVDDLAERMDASDYDRLVAALGTLGHVGEGHCYEADHGYTGHRD